VQASKYKSFVHYGDNSLTYPSSLFDRPESSYPTIITTSSNSTSTSSTTQPPTHIPCLSSTQEIEQALRVFRTRMPQPFQDHSTSSTPPSSQPYDGPNDPWWIMLHSNLYTAEMMMWKEMAHHQRGGYERAISCARALVEFTKQIKPENWVHVG
jgi:hypothetical protein